MAPRSLPWMMRSVLGLGVVPQQIAFVVGQFVHSIVVQSADQICDLSRRSCFDFFRRTTARRQSRLIARRHLKKLGGCGAYNTERASATIWPSMTRRSSTPSGVKQAVCISVSSIQDQSMQFSPAILDSPPRFKVVPFCGDIRLAAGPSSVTIGVICRIEEGEFPSALIEDGRGLIWSVDPPKMLASQPSPSLNNHRLTGSRDLIRDIDVARRSRLGLLFFGVRR